MSGLVALLPALYFTDARRVFPSGYRSSSALIQNMIVLGRACSVHQSKAALVFEPRRSDQCTPNEALIAINQLNLRQHGTMIGEHVGDHVVADEL